MAKVFLSHLSGDEAECQYPIDEVNFLSHLSGDEEHEMLVVRLR